MDNGIFSLTYQSTCLLCYRRPTVFCHILYSTSISFQHRGGHNWGPFLYSRPQFPSSWHPTVAIFEQPMKDEHRIVQWNILKILGPFMSTWFPLVML